MKVLISSHQDCTASLTDLPSIYIFLLPQGGQGRPARTHICCLSLLYSSPVLKVDLKSWWITPELFLLCGTFHISSTLPCSSLLLYPPLTSNQVSCSIEIDTFSSFLCLLMWGNQLDSFLTYILCIFQNALNLYLLREASPVLITLTLSYCPLNPLFMSCFCSNGHTPPLPYNLELSEC